MISAAVGRWRRDADLSAQTTEAFWNAVHHVKPSVGGAQLLSPAPTSMYPFLRRAVRESGRGYLLLRPNGQACPIHAFSQKYRIRSGSPADMGSLSGRTLHGQG